MPSAISGRPRDVAMQLVALVGLLALFVSLFNYFWIGNGIHGSEGALLVVVSTLLLALAAGVIAVGWIGGGLRSLLETLIALDFLGTSVAAYFLQAWVLLGLIVLAFVAWVVHVVRPRTAVSNPN